MVPDTKVLISSYPFLFHFGLTFSISLVSAFCYGYSFIAIFSLLKQTIYLLLF